MLLIVARKEYRITEVRAADPFKRHELIQE